MRLNEKRKIKLYKMHSKKQMKLVPRKIWKHILKQFVIVRIWLLLALQTVNIIWIQSLRTKMVWKKSWNVMVQQLVKTDLLLQAKITKMLRPLLMLIIKSIKIIKSRLLGKMVNLLIIRIIILIIRISKVIIKNLKNKKSLNHLEKEINLLLY